MSKVKKIWVMRQQGPIHLLGHSLIVPGYLENDSGRTIHLVVPFHQAKRLMLEAFKLLDNIPAGEGVVEEIVVTIAMRVDIDLPEDAEARAKQREALHNEQAVLAKAEEIMDRSGELV